jgi:hypothetical protein
VSQLCWHGGADVLKYGIPYGDVEQMELLLGFVATQLVRVPAWRADRDAFIDEFAYDVLEMSSETEERWVEQIRRAKADGVAKVPTFQEVRSILEKRSLRFRWNNAAQLTHNADLAAKLVPVLSQRNWCLGWSESGGLVCGDTAVTLAHTREVRGYWSSPGFALPFTEVALPLSRHWVLLGRFEGVPSAEVKLNRPRVAELNNRALWHSERLVWSGAKDFPWIDDKGAVQVGADGLAAALERMNARFSRRAAESGPGMARLHSEGDRR